METSEELRKLFRIQMALNEWIGARAARMSGADADDVFQDRVKKKEENAQPQDAGCTREDEHDSKHI